MSHLNNNKGEATPELLLETAKKYISVFGGEISRKLLDKVASEMSHTHRVEDSLASDAFRLYEVEQDPNKLVFANEQMQVIGDRMGPEYPWMSLHVTHREPTLADYEAFIAALIGKFGRDKKFYVESDQGDEYFVLSGLEKHGKVGS